MNITLIPQRRDDTISVIKQSETLTINGVDFDFSVIPNGASLPASAVNCEYITGNIERINNVLYLNLLLPHGANPTPAQAFPQPIIDPADGILELFNGLV